MSHQENWIKVDTEENSDFCFYFSAFLDNYKCNNELAWRQN